MIQDPEHESSTLKPNFPSVSFPSINSHPHKVNQLSDINFGYCNVDGLIDNLDTVQQFVISNKFHIVAFSETWLTENSNPSFPGYSILRNDRGLVNLDTMKDTKGGGVAVLVHNSLRASIIHRSKVQAIGEVEFVIVKILDPQREDSLMVVCAYRPPRGASFFEFFETVAVYSKLHTHLIIAGDLKFQL